MDLERLYNNFEVMDDWQDRYRFIIDMGSKIPKLEESEKTEINRVHGCLSTVHMILQKTNDDPPRIEFKAESDAWIVNGLIAILHIVYDGKTSLETSQIDIKDIFAKLGLDRHLSINRRNGFFSMVERIQNAAHQIS